MEFMPDFTDLGRDDKYEKFFRFVLSKKIPDEELEAFQLRYIPDSVREIRNKKVYWGKEYRRWNDVISLKNWRSCAKQLQEEITKHKTILKNLDQLRRLFVPNSDDRNYFSQSMDPERVEALVSRIKENENDDNIILDMINGDPVHGKKIDFTHTFYIIYAACARYGDFRSRPSRNGDKIIKAES